MRANGGKWGVAEPTRDVFDWTRMVAAYKQAAASSYSCKMHTLIWGQQQPAWMTGLSAADQRAETEEWRNTVAARYPGIGKYTRGRNVSF